MGGFTRWPLALQFNPFANITNINESGERIRDQLAVLASPKWQASDEIHEDLLLRAVLAAWGKKQKQARIDDVVAFLKRARRPALYQFALYHLPYRRDHRVTRQILHHRYLRRVFQLRYPPSPTMRGWWYSSLVACRTSRPCWRQ